MRRALLWSSTFRRPSLWERLLLTTWSGGSFADSRIESLSLETGERATLLEGGGLARYLPTGHLVYSRASRLFAVLFDLDSMSSVGTPVPLVDDVLTERFFQTPQFATSPSGVLAYASGGNLSNPSSMIWLDASGVERIFDYQPVDDARISPDGERIVFSAFGETSDIWIHGLRGRQFTRLTASPMEEYYPDWTADGGSVMFSIFNRGQSGCSSRRLPRAKPRRSFWTSTVCSRCRLRPMDIGSHMAAGPRATPTSCWSS